MNKIKIFIISVDIEKSIKLSKLFDCLGSISKRFTSDEDNTNEEYEYFLDNQTINLSFKNNSILCVDTNDDISTGITIDDFEENNIFCVTFAEYNMISDYIFEKYDTLTIWYDSKISGGVSKNLNNEITYFENHLNNGIKYMYFLEETPEEIFEIVNKYLSSTSLSEKNQILLENQ